MTDCLGSGERRRERCADPDRHKPRSDINAKAFTACGCCLGYGYGYRLRLRLRPRLRLPLRLLLLLLTRVAAMLSDGHKLAFQVRLGQDFGSEKPEILPTMALRFSAGSRYRC